MSDGERRAWDQHWAGIRPDASLFGRIASTVRRQLLSRAVRRYAARYFPEEGCVVEMGCGTAESSGRIPLARRTAVALDFSTAALRAARRVPVFAASIQGDIERLPFASASLAGIWNLGVMEHFDEDRGVRILREFHRVLLPGARALLFWPPELGSSRLVLGPVEAIRSGVTGRRFRFFPDEVNRLRSKSHARRLLAAAGLETDAVDLTPRDAFIHLVVVARRPAA